MGGCSLLIYIPVDVAEEASGGRPIGLGPSLQIEHKTKMKF